MWFLFAAIAAGLWGLHYALAEQVFKHISVVSELAFVFVSAGILFGIVALWSGHLKHDISTLAGQPRVLLYLVVSAAAFILADFLISNSIVDKNATVASLIEISYPFFVALFSYLLFAEENLSLPTAMGGVLIFAGVATIYVFNR